MSGTSHFKEAYKIVVEEREKVDEVFEELMNDIRSNSASVVGLDRYCDKIVNIVSAMRHGVCNALQAHKREDEVQK